MERKYYFWGSLKRHLSMKQRRSTQEKESLTEAMKKFSSYLENLKNCEGAVELIEGVSLNFIIELVIG